MWVKKPDLELFANNWNIVKKRFTKILCLDLTILILILTLINLLLPPVLSMVLSLVTATKFITKESTFMIFNIEVSGAAIQPNP